jgi:hypothetical protein
MDAKDDKMLTVRLHSNIVAASVIRAFLSDIELNSRCDVIELSAISSSNRLCPLLPYDDLANRISHSAVC